MSGKKFAFSKVLIANRGEIACRIIRTLDRLGLESVAISHRLDHNARHAALATQAVTIKGDTPVAAHLDIDQMLAVAKATGADAIHPGYGFLSENARFCRAVRDAGLKFIGPDPECISLMGDKIEARRFAEAQGVPVAPSIGPTDNLAEFVKASEAIGFPLLIKAAAGGGGKGMSIVRSKEEITDKLTIAASEAARYFSDPRIYAERYIERPRHIEVQVFGDGRGGAIHLFDRECSIQRRFQKIIEEAPSVELPEALRNEICEAALRLARAARYANAGTVEFILAPDGKFYFLEMNTRLQVEHPVTEMITGLDLVEMQLDIASGASLPAQSEILAKGHAIECRICVENPARDFMPETGRILKLRLPDLPGLRFDSGVERGQQVSANFDPLLAKMIVRGETRQQAMDAMQKALREIVLLGVVTNIDYLARTVAHPAFQRGELHTGFLQDHAAALTTPALTEDQKIGALLAAALSSEKLRYVFSPPEPYSAVAGWRN